jgi:hypothetical protein
MPREWCAPLHVCIDMLRCRRRPFAGRLAGTKQHASVNVILAPFFCVSMHALLLLLVHYCAFIHVVFVYSFIRLCLVACRSTGQVMGMPDVRVVGKYEGHQPEVLPTPLGHHPSDGPLPDAARRSLVRRVAPAERCGTTASGRSCR